MEYRQVYYLSEPEHFQRKEDLYLEVRHKEGRVLDDDMAKALPDVSKSSPYAKEWRWRKRSFSRLKAYLLKKDKNALHIIDLGCGNGWMSNQLAENPDWVVTAVDLNKAELEQGARLFGRENLQFVYADVVSRTVVPSSFPVKKFDIIVLAASVQYFPDLGALFASLHPFLEEGGEIHIIDSNFYANEAAAQAAKQRTVDYYTKLGVPEMAAYYHHHLSREIRALGGKNLNGGFWRRFWRKPLFPWIRVRLSPN